jgi:very-short-patch-repair endonuclease
MGRDAEAARLERLFALRRDRLLDLSARNPLISYKHRPTSKRQVRFVDAVPDVVFGQLADDGAALSIQPLPEPDEVPEDERTEKFFSHLGHAKSADATYVTRLQELESSGTDGDFELAQAERELRDRIRAQLGLPPRPSLRAINASDHARTLGIDPSFDLPECAPKDRDRGRVLRTLKWPDALDALLSKIADDARLAEQEMGLSTLFLVFGFLEWSEADASEKHHTAPLLLLPVKLEKKRIAGRKTVFNLVATSESPETNLSLTKRIERDFNLLLPDFMSDDDDHQTVSEYLTAVQASIEGQKRWRVRRQLTLGHFAFGRLAIYADLDPDKWGQHPVRKELVRSVLSGAEANGDDRAPLLGPAEDYPIDDPEIEAIAPHLIHDADASQHSALIDVMKGKNLVIQGPPGTGKSQTITNVIANLIGSGMTVLFLAEKQAALEVVKRRMDKAGLGEFCLELHSDRASSRPVIESLKARHAIGYGPSRGANGVTSTGSIGYREIAEYLTALHQPIDGGVTPFATIWQSLRAGSREELQLVRFSDVDMPEELLHDYGVQQRVQSDLALYCEMLSQYEERFGGLALSPWCTVELGEALGPGESARVLEKLERLRSPCDALARRIDACRDEWGISTSGDMVRCASAIETLPATMPTQAMLDALRNLDREAVRDLLDALEELSAVEHERRSLPRLDEADIALLETIERSAALAEGDNDERCTPAELRQKAESTARAFRSVCEPLVAVGPTLQVAGIRGAAQGSVAMALAPVADLLSRIPRQFRAWALSIDESKAERFEQLYANWEKLARAEARWRGRFPALDNDAPWPSPAELTHVAGLRQKGRLAGLLGMLAGDRQTIEQLACRLRLPAIALPSPDELRDLAQHVEQVGAFLADRTHRQLLGPLWADLDTPFESLRSTWRDAVGVLRHVSSIERGADLLRELRRKNNDALDKIADGYEALAQLIELSADLRRLLSAHTINEIFWYNRTAEDRLVGLAAADPTNLLKGLSHSLGDLEQARQVELRRRDLVARVRDCGLSSAIPMLTAPGGTAAARVALGWFDATENAGLPQALKEELVRSVDRAEYTRSEAAACIDLERQIRGQAQHLEQKMGLTGLPIEDAHRLLARLDALLHAGTQLKEVIALRAQKRRLEAAGVAMLLERAEELGVPPGDWCDLLRGLVAKRQAFLARIGTPALRRASGLRLEAQRKAFIEQDRQRVVHDREVIRSAVRAITPPTGSNVGPIKQWTGMRLLKREFEKERRLLPVRQLVARAGGAMLAMKPCIMMSPLSLAKFLPPGSIEFDVLVIDEASQMRPEDALGGLLRARQVVVVGDQKQLPPTDFFTRSSGGDTTAAEEEDFEDSDDESILEACQKTFSNTRMLRWHYRSRCESLITFSNTHFYGNELITFPVARPGSFSVELRKVQGAYEARRNPPEAQQIVAEAIAFMREHADDDDNTLPTLGIVAINTEQRELISEELRLRAARDEFVERFQEKANARGEELFIKTLENVQGDERDVILISLTYGPKPGQTTPHQRFGPINGKHGHRRLNVLFSRARDRIVLFTSLRADQIVADPGKSQGPQVLKAYLAYAEARGQAVPETVGAPADSDFEIEVRKRLERHGYQVDTQVGVSRYRIDLGVRNPDMPGYLAGIECDGASYHSSKSARDRDRLRQDCLKSMGWEILRVWSTDWFDDPDGQTDKLARHLEELRKEAAERLRQEEMQRCQRVPSLVPEEDYEPTDAGLRGFSEVDSPTLPELARSSTEDGSGETKSAEEALTEATAPSEPPISDPEHAQFVMARVADCGFDPNPDRFYEASYRPALRRMVNHVVDTEGPIYRSELVTRIARAHGFQRNGAKIEERVLAAIGGEIATTTETDGRIVYWSQGAGPTPVVPFRHADPNARNAASIPLAELAGLARELLAPDRDDTAVMERMGEQLGLGRLREATRKRFAESIRLARECAG